MTQEIERMAIELDIEVEEAAELQLLETGLAKWKAARSTAKIHLRKANHMIDYYDEQLYLFDRRMNGKD